MRSPTRDRHDKRRPLALDARCAHRAAVQLDQFLHERQTDAGALEAAPSCLGYAIEALEDVRQLLGRDARSRVAHAQLGVVLSPAQGDLDFALEGALERVRD